MGQFRGCSWDTNEKAADVLGFYSRLKLQERVTDEKNIAQAF